MSQQKCRRQEFSSGLIVSITNENECPELNKINLSPENREFGETMSRSDAGEERE